MENQLPKSVKEFLYYNLQALTGIAMYHLGALSVDPPELKGMAKEIQEAQLAIDAIKALIETLKDRVTPQEKAGMESLLMDLQLRFVERKRGTS